MRFDPQLGQIRVVYCPDVGEARQVQLPAIFEAMDVCFCYIKCSLMLFNVLCFMNFIVNSVSFYAININIIIHVKLTVKNNSADNTVKMQIFYITS